MDARVLAATFVFASVAFGTLAVILVGELLALVRQRKRPLEQAGRGRLRASGHRQRWNARLLKKARDRSAGIMAALPWFADLELLVEQAGGGSLRGHSSFSGVGMTFAAGFRGPGVLGLLRRGRLCSRLIGGILPYVYLR